MNLLGAALLRRPVQLQRLAPGYIMYCTLQTTKPAAFHHAESPDGAPLQIGLVWLFSTGKGLFMSPRSISSTSIVYTVICR